MTVNVNEAGNIPAASSKILEDHNRELREEVYRKIMKRLQDKDALHELYSQLIVRRTIATKCKPAKLS